MINVTKTFLPDIDNYLNHLKNAWDSTIITNRGKLLQQLEQEIKEYLSVDNIIVMTNGTLPLQIAIKAMKLKGEIITTPFSYIATTSSIIWENCKPVFVDIDSEHLTIDENKIEAAITPATSSILATHVFGNPCNVEKIEEIAKKHKLKVIYDAAHCFGVKYNNKSIFKYGDVSTCSFHATKLFHTGEGGALFCNDDALNDTCFYHHNFGHNGPEKFHGLGINAKMSELHAAMGLSVLPYVDELISKRKYIIETYKKHLNWSNLKSIKIRKNCDWNHSYFPIIFDTEKDLEITIKLLNEHNIFPRRYFYPSLNTLEFVSSTSMPISESIASRIICLPLYYDLHETTVMNIIEIVNNR